MSDDRLHSEPKLWHWRRDALSTGTFGIVDDVIDGNSMETRWAGIRQPRVVRLAGVDAPGVKEPFGEEALDFLRSMVSRASSRNFSIDEFELAPDKKSATGVVYFNSLPAEGDGEEQGHRSANYHLVRMGLARASTRYGKFAGMYHAEDAARAEGLGIWSGDGPEASGRSDGTLDEHEEVGDGVVVAEAYGVPENLPMTALLIMAAGIWWAYQSGVWELWAMASYALADAVPVGTFAARWAVWGLMGLAALSVVPAVYLAAYTTLSKYRVGFAAGLPEASRPLYIAGAAGAAAAALIGGFLTALCVVDPLDIPQLSGRGEFAPALTQYYRGLIAGTLDAYPLSQEWRGLQISKPWALYLFVTSYCGVVASISLSALAAGEGRLKRLPWQVGWNLGWTLGAPVRLVYMLIFSRLRTLLVMAAIWALAWAACNAGIQWVVLD